MKKVVGIMGPGMHAKEQDIVNAFEIGKYCANQYYVILTGGLNIGVMNAALKGAKENNGLTIGILPTDDKSQFSEYLDIPIVTTMRGGRNYINIMSSDIVVACGIEAGTSSEISLAVKEAKKVILVGLYEEANTFYNKLAKDQIFIAKDYTEATKLLEEIDW